MLLVVLEEAAGAGAIHDELEGRLPLIFAGADAGGITHNTSGSSLFSLLVPEAAGGVTHDNSGSSLLVPEAADGVNQLDDLFLESLGTGKSSFLICSMDASNFCPAHQALTIATPKASGYAPDSRRTSFLPVHLFFPFLSTWTSEVRIWFSFEPQGQAFTIGSTQ